MMSKQNKRKNKSKQNITFFNTGTVNNKQRNRKKMKLNNENEQTFELRQFFQFY